MTKENYPELTVMNVDEEKKVRLTLPLPHIAYCWMRHGISIACSRPRSKDERNQKSLQRMVCVGYRSLYDDHVLERTIMPAFT